MAEVSQPFDIGEGAEYPLLGLRGHEGTMGTGDYGNFCSTSHSSVSLSFIYDPSHQRRRRSGIPGITGVPDVCVSILACSIQQG